MADLIRMYGDSNQRIADALSTSRQVVWHWRKNQRIPHTWQRLIERITGGKLRAR